VVVAHSVPPATQVTAPDVGRAELEATTMAFDGAAQFALSRAPPEVVVTTINPVGSDTAVVASEGVAQSMPPAIHAVAPRAGRMEEDMVEESSVIMMVVGRTRREPPLALLSGGDRSPTRGELPL